MVRRPTPPSSVPPPVKKGQDAAAPAQRKVDVRAWMAASRLSGFTAIMLGLVVIAVFVLVPTISTYIGQRQQIAALQQSVQVTKDQIAELQRQKARWDDPAYITTQARERLYFTKPGEVVYLVEDDVPDTDIPQEKKPVSDEVEATQTDWMAQLLRSVAEAGLAKTAVPTSESPAPTPTGSGSPTR